MNRIHFITRQSYLYLKKQQSTNQVNHRLSSVTSDFSSSPFTLLSMCGSPSPWEFCGDIPQSITPVLCKSDVLFLEHFTSRTTSFPSSPASSFLVLLSVYQGLYCALENGDTSKLGKILYDSRASFLARKQNKLGCNICKMSCYGRHCEELAWVPRREDWLRVGELNS